MVEKTCEICGAAYSVPIYRAARRRTCSKECRFKLKSQQMSGAAHPRYKGEAELRPCAYCGTAFKPRYAERHKMYCAKECHLAHQKETDPTKARDDRKHFPKNCPNCGKSFIPDRKGQLTCSWGCRAAYVVGDKHPSWQGGDMTRICKGCDEPFTFPRAQRHYATYCSRACYSRANSEMITCAYCGEQAKKPKSRLIYERSFCCDDHRLLWLNSPYDGRESLAEREMMGILGEMGITYAFQLPLGKYLLDFAVEGVKLDIEVDSEYHHALPGRPEADKRRDAFSEKHGWRVLRIPSMQVTKDREGVKRAILAALAV